MMILLIMLSRIVLFDVIAKKHSLHNRKNMSFESDAPLRSDHWSIWIFLIACEYVL